MNWILYCGLAAWIGLKCGLQLWNRMSSRNVWISFGGLLGLGIVGVAQHDNGLVDYVVSLSAIAMAVFVLGCWSLDTEVVKRLLAMVLGKEKQETSESHPYRVDFLRLEGPTGSSLRIGLGCAPGRKKGKSIRRDVVADVRRIKEVHQVDVVVTLCSEGDVQKIGSPPLLATIQQQGMTVIHFPIRDKFLPESARQLAALLDQLVLLVAHQGRSILVHCNGGKGRTGLVVACLLFRLGLAASVCDARHIISLVRPGCLINPLQQLYALCFFRFLIKQTS